MTRGSRYGQVTIPPEFWARPELAGMLMMRIVEQILRAVIDEFGLSQRDLAFRIGMAQSEISEILGGRRVQSVRVLERVADGLGCPRWRMNLAAMPSAAEMIRPAPLSFDRPAPRPVVPVWNGALIREFRHALRMPIRAFAARVGVTERAVSIWEAAGAAIEPRPSTQRALDTLLCQAPDDAVARFARWVPCRWVLHVRLPGLTYLRGAAEVAMKVAQAAGVEPADVTLSPAATEAHHYPAFCPPEARGEEPGHTHDHHEATHVANEVLVDQRATSEQPVSTGGER